MAIELIIAPEAEWDIEQAYRWYEGRRAGLGEEFLSAVDACFHNACRHPELHPVVHEGYRRALIRRFPYAAFYEHAANFVCVYAVFHSAQDPAKWRDRLSRSD